MKVTSAAFLTSAMKPQQYPVLDAPDVAFAGRSNVGKSSLINSLAGRKGLVKVSKTPGKTRLLNFFLINERLMFVDMPGYGFANVPRSVKATWGEMVETYLKRRDGLKGVIMLLDLRRTPNDDDRLLLNWLKREGVPAIVVFTKIDKTPKTRRPKLVKRAMNAIADYVDENTRPVLYSAHTGEGKKELWRTIERCAAIRG